MGYTPSFTPPYENGWENLPLETTPITAEALNEYDDAIENIEEYLASDDSQSNLADAYDETETYEAGDYRIHNGDLYKCLVDIDEPEEWDSTKWESCLITEEMATSGGTTVIANPEGTATETLTKLQVENTIYGINGGGGSANIWEGTQAELEEEFDDIPNDTAIIVIDDEESIDASAEIYSEDERLIGLWTDNKPLYQKTIDCGALPANTTKSVPHGIENIDRIVYVNGCAFRSTSGSETGIPLPSTHYQTIGNQNEISVNFTNVILRNGNSSASSFDKAQVTIRYTKSTDVPLSGVIAGKSTMYIASSDCYSTEEKEVGCHVNGKPLYQKTWSVTSPSVVNTAENVVDTDGMNIDECVKLEGFIVTSNNQTHTGGNSFLLWYRDAQSEAQYRHKIACQVTNSSYLSSPLIITAQYTKTTDTAGSGKVTPANTVAEHYSTEEQVIGTWINGETIYRKTIHKVNTAVMNGTEIAHGISNLGMCINLSVICFDESGVTFPIMAIGSQYADNTSERSMGFRINATNFVAYGKNEFTAQATRHWYFTVDYIKTA